MVKIGKIVKSENHYLYVGQVYKELEVENPPIAKDFELGTFVRIQSDQDFSLYGLIIDTILSNPEYGKYGPRFTTEDQSDKFFPDYLNELATLVHILAIGCVENKIISHGVPHRVVNLNDEIWSISESEIKRFHLINGEDFHWGYFLLLRQISPTLSSSIITKLYETLTSLFTDKKDVISVLRQTFYWRYQKEVLY